MPRYNTGACWNPAVPPPPAPGAAVGNELAGAADGGAGLGLGVGGAAVVALGVGGLGVGVPGVGVPGLRVTEADGLAGPLPPGENEGGAADGDEPDEQADTDVAASMTRAAPPRPAPRKRRRP